MLQCDAVESCGDSLGGSEEDQRLLLVLGRHVPLHQLHTSVVTGRAQRCRFLWVSGRAHFQWTEGSYLCELCEREPVRTTK